jgi:MurNAc alpha-1-phosphate uridylyltransferase
MLLAAGRGERLRPLTDERPKPLLEVGGQSLLERHLQTLHAAGIRTVVINLGWLGEQIVQRVGSGANFGLEVVYSPEGDNILETGGGIHNALPLLGDDPFIVVNADVFTDMPLPTKALEEGMQGHLVMVPQPEYRPHGDFDLRDGLVRNGDQPSLTFSGVAIYRPEFFAGCEAGRFPLAPMLREAADAGQLSGEVYSGTWMDVGTPERLRATNDEL